MNTLTRWIVCAGFLGFARSRAANAAPKTLWPTAMEPRETVWLSTRRPFRRLSMRRRRWRHGHPEPRNLLTGSLFLKSGVTLDVPEGVTLVAPRSWTTIPCSPHASRASR